MIRSTGRRVANMAQGVMGNLRNAAPAKASSAASRGRGMASQVSSRVSKHPYRYGGAAIGGLGAVNYMTRNRRGRGIDKAGPGRPTGMYKY